MWHTVEPERWLPIVLDCAVCGKRFQRPPSDRNRRKHCSRKCANQAKRGRVPWNKLGQNLNCLQCGHPFWVSPARLRRTGTGSPKYCSRRCLRLANNTALTAPSIRAKAALKRWSNPVHHQVLAQAMRRQWQRMAPAERERRLANMLQSNVGKHISGTTRERIRQARLRQIFPTRDTKIERTMQQELSGRSMTFTKHLPILNCCQADIAFPEEKLAVFCDGDYWHNRPDVRSKDIAQEMILRANGWRVLRFWEHEINTNPAACAERVANELATS